MKHFVSRTALILAGILILALFLRIYRMNDLLVFGGDVARDYLAGRDITLHQVIPLLGSPSSVPWLHQGAFFTYVLGVVLWIGNYNPLSGGYFVGILGVFSVWLIYFLGKKFISEKAGLLSAFCYAVSPIVVIFDRYPYHQSIISLFVVLFFLSFFYAIKKNEKFFLLSAFVFGLLMQIELSNFIFFPVLTILFLDFRQKISLKLLFSSFFAFLVTWTPKIIYDLSNGFTQTLGFGAWVFHKLVPLSIFGNDINVATPFSERIFSLFNLYARLIFWPVILISLLIFLFAAVGGLSKFKLKERKNYVSEYLLLLWLIFPVLGFLIQGSPSESYLPAVFALPCLLLGKVYENYKKIRFFLAVLIIIFGFFNVIFLLQNDYFMLEGKNSEKTYNLGQSYKITSEMAKFIVLKAAGRPFNLVPLGSYAIFPSSKLDLTYLCWYFGNQPSEQKTKLKFYVYDINDKIDINGATVERFPYMKVAWIEER